MTQPPEPFFAPLDIAEAILAAWPAHAWIDVGVIVGVSGGADSVALVRALESIVGAHEPHRDDRTSGIRRPTGFLVVAHFNHRLRGRESDADEAFVRTLASDLGLRCITATATEASSSVTDEAGLAKMRQQFFIDSAKKLGARYIATAHHQDDNLETFLHHLLRGTGPAGLCGMPTFRSIDDDWVLARPLLQVTRAQLRDYLESIGQPFRHDQSNDDPRYTRNWIRHHWLPMAAERFPKAPHAISRLISTMSQWRSTIESAADDWLEQHARIGPPHQINRDRSADPAILVAAAQRVWERSGWPRRAMTQQHWTRLAECLVGNRDERQTLPHQIDVSVEGNQVWIRRLDKTPGH